MSTLLTQLRRLTVKPVKKGKTRKTPMAYKISPMVKTSAADDSKFSAALSNPFSPQALGARICDSYAFPTATYHIHGTTSVVSPAGNTAGTVFVSAHPILSYADLSAGNWGATSYTGITSLTQFTPGNPAIFGATSPAVLAGLLGTYRVVSVGFKIRVQEPELVRTGRLIYAPVPLARDVPPYSLLTLNTMSAVNTAGTRILGGVTLQAAQTAGILSLPGAVELSLNDMALKDLLLVPKPCAPSYQTFHTSIHGSSYSNQYSEGDTTGTNVPGFTAFAGLDHEDVIDPSGFTGFLLHWEAIPSAANPVFDIEDIYHLEGPPALTGTTGIIPPVPSGMLSTHVNPGMFDKVLAQVSRAPWGAMIEAGVANLGILGRVV
jgi:hypothetical protein